MNISMNPNPMNHEEAVRNQMAERFVLGELTQHDSQRFEEHFFDCNECFENARLASEFLHYTYRALPREPEKSRMAHFIIDLWRPAARVMATLFLATASFAVFQQTKIARLQEPVQVWPVYLTEQTRSPGNEKEISVPPGVLLELGTGFLQRDEFTAYRFLILSEPDKRTRYMVPLHLQENDTSGTVVIPQNTLQEGTYSVLIQGKQRDGQWKALQHGQNEAGGVFHIHIHGA